MKGTFLPAFFSAALLTLTPAFPQADKPQEKSERKATKTPSGTEEKSEKTVKTERGTEKHKAHTVIGTVKEYQAGKLLEVTTANNKTRKFDLDQKDVTVNVAPDIAVGAKVKVVEKTDETGHKTITVEPRGGSQKSTPKTGS